MIETLSLDDLSALAESVDLECKAAQGRDGNGEVPQDVWKSYCAMANTDGGTILLGVKEDAERETSERSVFITWTGCARRFGTTCITAKW
jgi:predicted HTH transcriptional regulator